jgi:hypothetical protein
VDAHGEWQLREWVYDHEETNRVLKQARLMLLRRMLAVIVAVVAPIPLAAFFLFTDRQAPPYRVTMALATLALAHIVFWPVFFLTSWIGRRVGVSGAQRHTVLAGSVAAILFLIVSTIYFASEGHLSWRLVLRDSLPPALGVAASDFLYRSVRAWETLWERSI